MNRSFAEIFSCDPHDEPTSKWLEAKVNLRVRPKAGEDLDIRRFDEAEGIMAECVRRARRLEEACQYLDRNGNSLLGRLVGRRAVRLRVEGMRDAGSHALIEELIDAKFYTDQAKQLEEICRHFSLR